MKGLGVVTTESRIFTKEELIERMPQRKKTITNEVVDLINEANTDPDFDGDQFVTTLVDYQSAMIQCSSNMKEYINAIKFCAYLETELEGNGSIVHAYIRARGNDEFVIKNKDLPKDSPGYRSLCSRASTFRRSKLVKQILTQSDMPLYLMFQGARFKAVAVLQREMETAKLSRDRINAADKVLAYIKPPENVQVELAVGPNQEAVDLSEQLSMQLAQSVAMQQKLLESGVDLAQATKTNVNLVDDADIITAEVTNGDS